MPKFLIIVEDLVKEGEMDGYGQNPGQPEKKTVNARRLRRILGLTDNQGFKLRNPVVIRVDEQVSGFKIRKDDRSLACKKED